MKYDDFNRWTYSDDGGGAGGDGPDQSSGGQGDEGAGTLLNGAQSEENLGGSQANSQDPALGNQGAASSTAPKAQDSTAPFDFRSLINDEGNFIDNWIDQLPENLKADAKHYSKYKSPIHALEHTRNLQQLVGKKADAVIIPGEGATEQEIAEYRAKIGVPDTPEGYGIKTPDDLPEGVEVSDEIMAEFAGVAHKLGLTPEQVNGLQQWEMGRVGAMSQANETAAHALEAKHLEDNRKALQEEWGTGKEFDEKITLATRAGRTFGYSAQELESNPIFRNAEVVKILAKAGADMSEDRLVSGDEGSPQSLKAQAQDIISNPQNAEYAKYWAGDEAVNAKVRSWMK